MNDLTIFTTCNHCQRKFAAPSALIIGEAEQIRLARFFEKLGDHMATQHQEIAIRDRTRYAHLLQLCGNELGGFVLLENFTSNDPELLKQGSDMRRKYHAILGHKLVTDETIEKKVALAVSSNEESPVLEDSTGRLISHLSSDVVIDLLKQLRDVYEVSTVEPAEPEKPTSNLIVA